MSIDYTKGRTDKIRALLVNPHDVDDVYGELDGFQGGELNFSYYSTNKVGGSIDVFTADNIGYALVRIVDEMTQGDEAETLTLATMFAVPESVSYLNGASVASITLESTLTKISGDYYAGIASFSAGSNPITQAETIMTNNGLEYVVSGDTTKTLSSDISFDENDAKSTVVNGLLSNAGFASVSVDAYGKAIIQPYVAPASKTLAWTFDATNCMVAPGITIEREAIPNKVIASATIDNVLTTVTLTLSAASKYSYNNTGRWVTEVYQADVDSASALTTAATNYFKDVVQSYDTITINHHYAPIKCGDVVYLNQDDISAKCLVKSIDMSLEPGLPCKTVLSKLSDVEVVNG